jgi:hypothetical protein
VVGTRTWAHLCVVPRRKAQVSLNVQFKLLTYHSMLAVGFYAATVEHTEVLAQSQWHVSTHARVPTPAWAPIDKAYRPPPRKMR